MVKEEWEEIVPDQAREGIVFVRDAEQKSRIKRVCRVIR